MALRFRFVTDVHAIGPPMINGGLHANAVRNDAEIAERASARSAEKRRRGV